ncbi:MAG: nuclear transport factor 2 family protein [Acidobacteriota bacterium]
MSQDNLELVRRTLEAFVREDMEAVVAELDPEIEIDDTDIPDGDDYRGHDAFFKWLARWDEGWETSRIEDIEVLQGTDDRVVAPFRMIAQGKGSGIELERKDAIVCELRNAKITRIGYYNDQGKARKAAGLSE